MKFSLRTMIPALLVAMLIGGMVMIDPVSAQPPSGRQPGERAPREGGRPQPGGPGGRGASIDGAMRTLNRAIRDITPNIADASKKEENLTSVWQMQLACVNSKRAKPEGIKGDAKPTVEDFRRDQMKLMAMLVELETAVMDGKTAEASKTLEKVVSFRDEAHRKYGVDDGDEPAKSGAR